MADVPDGENLFEFAPQAGCSFCKLVPGNDVSYYANTDCFVLPTRSPRAETHLLVVPRLHFPTLNDPGSWTLGRVMLTVQQVARERKLDGYRVIINVGETGKQKVFHLHVHLLAGPEVVEEGFARSVTD